VCGFQRQNSSWIWLPGGLRFHDLRHSYGTWLADDGIVTNKLAKVMGHEDIATTMQLYVRRTEDHDAIRDLLDWWRRFIGMLPLRCLIGPESALIKQRSNAALTFDAGQGWFCHLDQRVGVAGFEPTTSSSRTKRATKLRHTPREATTAYRTAPAPRQRALPRQPRRPAAAVRDRCVDHIRSGRECATHSGVE
jgi:hypothetical protein